MAYGPEGNGEIADMVSMLAERAGKSESGSPVVLLLAERAPSEGPRSTRAFEDQPATRGGERKARME